MQASRSQRTKRTATTSARRAAAAQAHGKLLCAVCRALTQLCGSCFRGQSYCSDSCRLTGRRRSLRAAGQRYQRTELGRLKHAAASAHTPHAAEPVLPAPRARQRQRLRLSLTPRRASSSRRGLRCPLRPRGPAPRIRQRPPRCGLACAADAQTPAAGCLTVVGCLIAAGKPGIAPRHEASEPTRRRDTDSRPGHSNVERRFTQSAMNCQPARSPNSKAARRAFCERIAPPRPIHTAERSASWRFFHSPRAFHRHLQRRPPRFPALCGAF